MIYQNGVENGVAQVNNLIRTQLDQTGRLEITDANGNIIIILAPIQ